MSVVNRLWRWSWKNKEQFQALFMLGVLIGTIGFFVKACESMPPMVKTKCVDGVLWQKWGNKTYWEANEYTTCANNEDFSDG